MAATYKPITAFQYAKNFIKKMPLDEVQVQILDSVNKIIWMAAPWRWTIASLPTVTLASNMQDYNIALPANYLYPITAYTTTQSDSAPRFLRIVPNLPVGGMVGQPNEIAITGAANTTGTARFHPKPTTLASPAPVMISQYKKMAPSITRANASTGGILVMDDEWAHVFESGVLWLAYQYADDSRAGTTNYDSRGQYAFTGQRAIFETNLVQMREREKLLIVDSRVPDAEASK